MILLFDSYSSPLPSGDWGLQSSHWCGCGPTKGSESLIRDGGQVGGGCQITLAILRSPSMRRARWVAMLMRM